MLNTVLSHSRCSGILRKDNNDMITQYINNNENKFGFIAYNFMQDYRPKIQLLDSVGVISNCCLVISLEAHVLTSNTES